MKSMIAICLFDRDAIADISLDSLLRAKQLEAGDSCPRRLTKSGVGDSHSAPCDAVEEVGRRYENPGAGGASGREGLQGKGCGAPGLPAVDRILDIYD